MTKPITTVAAMQLFAQGKIHLSNSIEKFVPELAGINVLDEQGLLVDTETPVTMHQLLNHTAGFPTVCSSYRSGGRPKGAGRPLGSEGSG